MRRPVDRDVRMNRTIAESAIPRSGIQGRPCGVRVNTRSKLLEAEGLHHYPCNGNGASRATLDRS